MTQVKGVCILLAAGLTMAAPCGALAQNYGASRDDAATPQADQRTADTRAIRVHQAYSDERIAAHYARGDDRRADEAWKNGDRPAACRWAKTAQTDASGRRADYEYKVDEYCTKGDQ